MAKSLAWAYLSGGAHGAGPSGFVRTEEARISPLDRGFLFGDAVYEVMPVYAGRVFALDRHLKRLARSLGEVAIGDPYPPTRWAELIEELVVRNGGGDQLVYLQVSRGADEGRDHRFPQGVPPTVFMMGSPYLPPTVERFAAGRSAFTQPDLRWGRCDIKTTMLMANCMAKEFAGERGGNEAVLVRDGLAMEGTSSTLYIVKDGTIVTPPLTHKILPGVTREVVLELAAALNVPVEQRDIPLDELFAADEVWFSNTSAEIMPVTKVDDHAIGRGAAKGAPGPVWRKVFDAFQRRKAEEWERPVVCALPDAQAAQSAIEYPTRFPIKVMGKNTPDLKPAVLALVGGLVGGEQQVEVSQRLSENGNFLALTLTIHARSQQQVDDIYRALTKHPLVMMAL